MTPVGVVVGVIACVAVGAVLAVVVRRMTERAGGFYEDHHKAQRVMGCVSGWDEPQTRMPRRGAKRTEAEAAFPIYKAKVDGHFVESPGLVRYRVTELAELKKTRAGIELWFEPREGRLWRLEEIPLRKKQMVRQAVVFEAVFIAVVFVSPWAWSLVGGAA